MKASSSVAAIIVAGVLIGAAVGWVGYSKFSKTKAIFILNVGEINQTKSFVEDPDALIERMKSPAFAASVSERAKLPELAILLPSVQYGGKGQLTARSLRPVTLGSPSLIEVAISSSSSQNVEAAAVAASQQILEDHAQRLAPFLEEMKRRADKLRGQPNFPPMNDDNVQQMSPAGADVREAQVLPSLTGYSSGRLAEIDELESNYFASISLAAQQGKQTTLLFTPVVIKPSLAWMMAAPFGGVFVGIVFVVFALRIRREVSLRANLEDEASIRPT
jgi:hypothetical protein